MRRHTKTHIGHYPTMPTSPTQERNPKPRQKTTAKSISDVDDDLIDELEDDASSSTTRSHNKPSQTKRRKITTAQPSPARDPPHAIVSSRSGSDSPATTMRSGPSASATVYDEASGDDDLNELLGNGKQRTRPRAASPVYTSSDASGEEDEEYMASRRV